MLTREQIEAMTPDEVNRYLAEKVMGWRAYGGWITDNGGLRSRWNPSGCIDDAMEAAEKIILKLGSHASFRTVIHGDGMTPPAAYWKNPDIAPFSGNILAIVVCRAVIAAHEASLS